MASQFEPVPIDELVGYSTKQLLALRNKLLACEESLDCSDMLADEIDSALICFKDDSRWQKLYEATKSELSTREHVPNGSERKAERQAQGKEQRSRDRRGR